MSSSWNPSFSRGNNIYASKTKHSMTSFYSISHTNRDDLSSLKETCCGWLWMRTSRFRRWKYRYFSLKNGVISYYDKFPAEDYFKSQNAAMSVASFFDGSQSKGVLRVAHVEEIMGNSLGFKIYGSSGKSIDIRAAKASIRTVWVRALAPLVRRSSRSWQSSNSPRAIDGTMLSTASSGYGDDSASIFETNMNRHSVQITKSGWLRKRGDILRQWHRYYFVLQGNMLSYYTSMKPYDVPRRRGYVTEVSRTGECGLSIVLNTGKALLLRAENNQDVAMWHMVVRQSMETTNSAYSMLNNDDGLDHRDEDFYGTDSDSES